MTPSLSHIGMELWRKKPGSRFVRFPTEPLPAVSPCKRIVGAAVQCERRTLKARSRTPVTCVRRVKSGFKSDFFGTETLTAVSHMSVF